MAEPRPPRRIRLNPWPSILAGVLIVALGLGGLGLWAANARLAAGTLSPGILVVETKRKNVQHLEGGIVAEINVRDGDLVEQNDVLLVLDGTQAKVAVELLDAQYYATRAEIARLQAERDGQAVLDMPQDLSGAPDQGNSKITEIVNTQQRLFEARQSQLSGEEEILRTRIDQFDQQIEGLNAQEKAAIQQFKLITEELKGLNVLLKKGFTSRTRVLALERAMADLEGQRGARKADIARIIVAIGETRLEILQLHDTFNTQVIDELRIAQDRLFDLEQRRMAAADLKNRLEIRAPVSGTVVTSQVHTTGGVIEPGQILMQIIPDDDRLMVEARIRPQDIDLVQNGMTAEIRFSAFSQRNMPAIFGTLSFVSADIIAEPRTGQSYYLVEIEVSDREIDKLGDNQLKAGMPIEVLIQAGEHTALEYLTRPVADILGRAFREM